MDCGKEIPDNYISRICRWGGDLRGKGFPSVTGTRDSFGIGRQFIDKKSGKVIDNFKSWEKAGYRDPMDTPEFKDIRNEIKRKKEKIRKYDTKKKTHIRT